MTSGALPRSALVPPSRAPDVMFVSIFFNFGPIINEFKKGNFFGAPYS